MDGKGAWGITSSSSFRFWRTIKYEEVYLRAYADAFEAKAWITSYIMFHNQERPHSSLDGRTPHEVYFSSQPFKRAA